MLTESGAPGQFAELWHQLTPTQRRFVIAMQEHPTKKEACESLGISPSTAYNWPSIVNDALDLIRDNLAMATLGILQANATKAAAVKAAGLDSKDEQVAQRAATEIIERAIGKVTQQTDITSGGEPIPITYIRENRGDDASDD